MLTYHGDCTRVQWHVLANIIEQAGLGTRTPALVERAFRGSYTCCFAEEDGTLVGAGRAISDGVSNSAIFDVVVLPAKQGKGIGKAIMHSLLERLPQRSVLLVSVPSQRKFYEKLGFHKLKTAYLRHEDIERWVRDGYIDEETDRDVS
jgi:ribosomal protein S18 acetylase RimI-like enzyme